MPKTQITTDSITDLAVTEAKIANLAVAEGKIAGNAVTSAKINDGTVAAADLASSLDLTGKTVTLPQSAFATVDQNIALLGFKMAVNDGLTVFNLVDGVVDEFHDESGTDEGEGSNDAYCGTSDFYKNQTDPVSVSAAFTTTAITEPQTSTTATNPAYKAGTYGTFTVPSGLSSVNIQAWGAGGGQGNRTEPANNGGGGGGGYAEGTLAVTSSQVMRVVIGEGGRHAIAASQPSPGKGLGGAGGIPATVAPSDAGSFGGGMAGVFTCAVAASPIVLTGYSAPAAIVIAGGGGGGGFSNRNAGCGSADTCVASGGAGGGLIGDAGGTENAQAQAYGTAGGGGSQTAGGQGGASEPGTEGSDGVLFGGGNPAPSDGNTGSGGGGYYGGGGSSSTGGFPFCNNGDLRNGGGGSSYYGHPQITSGSTEDGTYSEGGGVTQPNYASSTNEGTTAPGNSGNGEDGYVLLTGTAPGSTTSTTIVSNAFTAGSAPSSSRIVVFQENIDTPTLNTDVIASISRDGGTTFTTATLTDSGYVTGSSGQRILTGTATISGQPSGTSMRWKLALANNAVKIHGVSLQWK